MAVILLESADFDLARRRRRHLGNGDRQHAVGRSAVIRSPSIDSANSKTRLKRAVAALDLVVVHRVAGAGPGLAASLNRQPRVLDRELDLLAAAAPGTSAVTT